MDTATPNTTTANTDAAPRAGNRTLDDVAQMHARNRQPAAASSAPPAPVVAPAAPSGTVTPPANEAPAGEAVAATESPLDPTPAPADATAGETASGSPESAAAPEGAADLETPPDTAGSPLDDTPPGDTAGEDSLAAEIAAALQGGDVPKAVKQLVGRVGELTRKLREAETREQSATRAELETPPAANAPAAAHPALRQLDGERAQVLNVLEILDANPQGGPMVYPPGHPSEGQPITDAKTGQPLQYTPAQVRELRRNYTEQLSGLNEERAVVRQRIEQQIVSARESTLAQTRQLYPELWDRSSRLHQIAMRIYSESPGLKNNPVRELVVARLAAAEVAEEGRRGKVKLPVKAPPMTRPKATGAPAPVVTQAAAAPRQESTPAQKQIQELEGKQRTVNEQAKLIALRRAAKAA